MGFVRILNKIPEMISIGNGAISANLCVQILQVKLYLFVEELSIAVDFLFHFDDLGKDSVQVLGELIIHFWK